MAARLFDPPDRQSERKYQTEYQKVLNREGWLWVYVRRMRTPDGRWLTGTSDAGWPDIVGLRDAWTLVTEVKAQGKYPTPAQHRWLEAWHKTGALVWVIRPGDDRQMLADWVAHPEDAPTRFGW